MIIFLDLCYTILALLATPFILARMAGSERWRAGLVQRLGDVPPRRGNNRCIWIHAVSVGEVNAVRPLVGLLDRECPGVDIRVSTITNTGQAVARKHFGPERCFYFPLDLSHAVHRTLRRIRPDVIVLAELELWPNFLRLAARRGVPVVIANGRMRDKMVGRYRAFRFLFTPIMDPRGRNVFCVQNETYRDRFERAGFPADRLHVTGNMKYDAVRTEVDQARLEAPRDALGLVRGDRIWLAACTWPGEEEICLRVHRRLQERQPALKLVIAPRHIERAGEVERAIAKAGYACRRRTRMCSPCGAETVGLLDTVGELGYVYALADFAFIGNSLTARGGHNMLEAAALGVPTVFGPFTDNFREEAEILLASGGAERVASEAELGEALLRLLTNPERREQRARSAREAVLSNQGASRRHLEILCRVLANRARPE